MVKNGHVSKLKTKIWLESVFHKDDFHDFEWVYFSNKHHKSYGWPKNFKKIYFLATLAKIVHLKKIILFIFILINYYVIWSNPGPRLFFN